MIFQMLAMKRLSPKRKAAFAIWQRREYRKRRNRSSVAENHGRIAAARQYFSSVRGKLPATIFDDRKYPKKSAFVPPKVFSFVSNYEETLAYIMDFKQYFSLKRERVCKDGVKRHVYADFAAIEEIDAGAGLVLAAEVHRFSQGRGKPTEVHDDLWNENVRDFFVESGLFDLLQIDPRGVKVMKSATPSRETLKFVCGRTTEGRDAKNLIANLRNLSKADLGSRPKVYTAVAEALANVGHAYPDWFRTWPFRTTRQWWASGFWDQATQTVGLQLYDQGAGIPLTLPKQKHYPRLLRWLDSERNASGLIKAALQYGRTSTGTEGRGKGLSEMAEWIETTGSGFLRIISGGGMVTCSPRGKIIGKDLNAPFCGTLIEWQVQVA